jgi:hypothetical protein
VGYNLKKKELKALCKKKALQKKKNNQSTINNQLMYEVFEIDIWSDASSEPDPAKCNVPPAISLLSNRSSHRAAFSRSLNDGLGCPCPISRNVNVDSADAGKPASYEFDLRRCRSVDASLRCECSVRQSCSERSSFTGEARSVVRGEGDDVLDNCWPSRLRLVSRCGGDGELPFEITALPTLSGLSAGRASPPPPEEESLNAWKLFTGSIVENVGIGGDGGSGGMIFEFMLGVRRGGTGNDAGCVIVVSLFQSMEWFTGRIAAFVSASRLSRWSS